MKKSVVMATFKSDIQKVWDTVTDNKNYSWRSDLSKIEIAADGQKFIEYAKNGFPTNFTITLKKPLERYEFEMENKNMHGHWVGIFSLEQEGTKIEFSEEVTVKNPIMNLLVGAYLKKQQAAYIADLRKALGE
ncbi:MAG: SRPBCC family protein [Firmicutes bacterium]|nr:SRPBCC family protein [Bacillota bacterium]